MSVITFTDGASVPKKARLSEGGDNSAEKQSQLHRFDGFTVDQILNDRPRDKLMIVSGKFEGSEEKAVVILEKTPFTKESASKILTANTTTELNLQNDIYSNFQCAPPSSVNGKLY